MNTVLIAGRKWMAKYCPILQQEVLYLTCMECEDKICENINLSEHNNTECETNSVKGVY